MASNRLIIVCLLLIIDSFHVKSQQQCSLTRRDAEGPFFVPGAPADFDTAPANEMQDKSKEMFLSGNILDRQCNQISGALVEIWYAGGPNGKHFVFTRFEESIGFFQLSTRFRRKNFGTEVKPEPLET